MPERGETRRRLVETTAQLLQRQGLNGTGVLEVLRESGAPRGSLYFHFPGGKEQLTVEAIDYSRSVITAWLRKSLDAHSRPRAAFADITERYARRLERDRKSTRLNSSHRCISYAVFCLKKKRRTPAVNSPA